MKKQALLLTVLFAVAQATAAVESIDLAADVAAVNQPEEKPTLVARIKRAFTLTSDFGKAAAGVAFIAAFMLIRYGTKRSVDNTQNVVPPAVIQPQGQPAAQVPAAQAPAAQPQGAQAPAAVAIQNPFVVAANAEQAAVVNPAPVAAVPAPVVQVQPVVVAQPVVQKNAWVEAAGTVGAAAGQIAAHAVLSIPWLWNKIPTIRRRS